MWLRFTVISFQMIKWKLLCILTIFDPICCLASSVGEWRLRIHQDWETCIELNKISEPVVGKNCSFSLLSLLMFLTRCYVVSLFSVVENCLSANCSYLVSYPVLCMTFTTFIEIRKSAGQNSYRKHSSLIWYTMHLSHYPICCAGYFNNITLHLFDFFSNLVILKRSSQV